MPWQDRVANGIKVGIITGPYGGPQTYFPHCASFSPGHEQTTFMLTPLDGVYRFPHSTLHQRDPRATSSLFDSYSAGGNSPSDSRSPGRPGGYGYGGYSGTPNGSLGGGSSSFRTATPNSKYVFFCVCAIKVIRDRGRGCEALRLCRLMRLTDMSIRRGQYSDAVLSSLESQNDEEVEGITAKVKMLKNVRLLLRHLSPSPWVVHGQAKTRRLTRSSCSYRSAWATKSATPLRLQRN